MLLIDGTFSFATPFCACIFNKHSNALHFILEPGACVFANALGLGFSDTRGVVSAEEAIAKIKESLALLKGLRESCPSIREVGHKDFC